MPVDVNSLATIHKYMHTKVIQLAISISPIFLFAWKCIQKAAYIHACAYLCMHDHQKHRCIDSLHSASPIPLILLILSYKTPISVLSVTSVVVNPLQRRILFQ